MFGAPRDSCFPRLLNAGRVDIAGGFIEVLRIGTTFGRKEVLRIVT